MRLPPTAPAPEMAATLSMEQYRTALFKAAVVARMHAANAAGQSAAEVAAEMADEQRALASVITEAAVVDVASTALLAAQAAINPNPRYQSTPEQAHESMRQIMIRRAAEAQQFAAMLSQPSEYTALAAMSPADAAAMVPDLRAVKTHEVLGDLLHLENGAPQVIAHIDATAKGAMFEHEALAKVFAADGALHTALMDGLARALPKANQPQIHALARDWLRAREAAATLTVELSANDGAAYVEAVRRSTEWHRQPHAAAAPVPASVVQTQGLTAYKTARVLEKEKTAHQRAEDIAYTINHALSCGTTDVVLQPLIAAAFGVNVGCGDSKHQHAPHDHHHGHDHGHDHYAHAKPKLTLKTFAQEAGHYFKGEIFGDFVAVPLTIAVQRFFPGFMQGLRKIFEPLTGWAFRMGANRTARHWAQKQGLAPDAPEVAAHAKEIYEHEVSHLPQAVVWNMFAYPIGAVGQKLFGHGRSYGEIFKSKLVGAVVSNGILIGGRMLAPGAAQKWDQMTGENVFLPVSKAVGKVFGVDEKMMEKAVQNHREREQPTWVKRTEPTPAANENAASTGYQKVS